MPGRHRIQLEVHCGQGLGSHLYALRADPRSFAAVEGGLKVTWMAFAAIVEAARRSVQGSGLRKHDLPFPYETSSRELDP